MTKAQFRGVAISRKRIRQKRPGPINRSAHLQSRKTRVAGLGKAVVCVSQAHGMHVILLAFQHVNKGFSKAGGAGRDANTGSLHGRDLVFRTALAA